MYDSELVGEDGHGNKYYEIKRGVQYGRHRYVIYKDVHLDEYTPTLVPPEWHGWLHNMNNEPPTTTQYLEPAYAGEGSVAYNPGGKLPKGAAPAAGAKEVYKPKGDYRHAQPRGWKKFTAWDPAAAGK